MNIKFSLCTLRPWRHGDQAELVREANNPRVASSLRDVFPHPYRQQDADDWIAFAARQSPAKNFAIEVDGHLAGGIGLLPGTDINRVSAEIGYWLGEAWWGRGIATDAVCGLTRHAFEAFPLNRLFATPFAGNLASCRVLEKAGYRLEGRMVGCAIKGGEIMDQLLYAVTREEAEESKVQGPKSKVNCILPTFGL